MADRPKNVEDIFGAFGDLFGEFFGKTGGSRRGKDLRLELDVELVELSEGGVRDIEVRRGKLCRTCTGTGYEPHTKLTECRACNGNGLSKKPVKTGRLIHVPQCDDCHGRGKIGTSCDGCMGLGTQPVIEKLALTIPPGVSPGASLRLKNRGDELRDGETGHLYVVLGEKKHPRLTRKEADLYVDLVVPPEIADVGGELTVDGLLGPHVVEIPPGVKDLGTLTLRGYGMAQRGKTDAVPAPMPTEPEHEPDPYRGAPTGRGDLIVVLRVKKTGFLKRLFRSDKR
jgi:molecular chaperone DnaJ